VRVVDARTGAPVPGAEVRASVAVSSASAEPVLPLLPEALIAGEIGSTERFGARWLCDEQGEVRIPREARGTPIVARKDEQWGCSFRPDEDRPRDPNVITIAVEPDESVRAVCTDPEGRPGIGALILLQVGPRQGHDVPGWTSGPQTWGQVVSAADGSVAIPHAQFWRARMALGSKVEVAGFVFLSDEMAGTAHQLFPSERGAEMHFPVSPSGSIEIDARATEGNTIATLRWLVPPFDFEDPDDVPESLIGIGVTGTRTVFSGVLLGHKHELVLRLPGWVDPRVTFDGPKASGERVAVALAPTLQAARVSGRLVDVEGKPFARRALQVWVEDGGQHFEPEEDWLSTDSEGRFAFDFPPFCAGADGEVVFVVYATRIGPQEPRKDVLILGDAAPSSFPTPPRGRCKLARELRAGENDLGDVICRAQ
jgi:hypothetical protein